MTRSNQSTTSMPDERICLTCHSSSRYWNNRVKPKLNRRAMPASVRALMDAHAQCISAAAKYYPLCSEDNDQQHAAFVKYTEALNNYDRAIAAVEEDYDG